MAYNESLRKEKERKEKEIELGYSPIMVTTSSIELSNPVLQPEVLDVTNNDNNIIPVSASVNFVNPSTLSSDGFKDLIYSPSFFLNSSLSLQGHFSISSMKKFLTPNSMNALYMGKFSCRLML